MANYHVHLTVPPDAPVPKGWKRTTILLEGAKVQTDLMLTKHYVAGRKNVSSVEDIKADIASLHLDGIIRVKIEQDDAFTLPITPTNYMEIHMLCPDGVVPKGSGWVKSSNPRKNTPQGPVYFFNKRVYNSPLTAEEFSNATLEEQDVSYTECKIEQVIYDSNREHDSWWA
jgi:hypothetical protein